MLIKKSLGYLIKLDEFVKKNVEYFLGQNLFKVEMRAVKNPTRDFNNDLIKTFYSGSCEVQSVAKT